MSHEECGATREPHQENYKVFSFGIGWLTLFSFEFGGFVFGSSGFFWLFQTSALGVKYFHICKDFNDFLLFCDI